MKPFYHLTFFICIAFISFFEIQCSKNENKRNYTITPEFNLYKIIDGKEISSIIKTSDGGYAGIVDVPDFEIIKFDPDFNILWDKSYSRSYADYATSILQTDDGGYLLIGDSDTTENNSTKLVIWACRLDAEGNHIWDKVFGGSGDASVYGEKSIIPTEDGGYIFTGSKSINAEDIGIWVVKINSEGAIMFEKTLNGTGRSFGQAIVETNGNYAILASVIGKNDMFSEGGTWIVSIDGSANVLWQTPLHGWFGGTLLYSETNEIVVASNTGLSAYQIQILGMDGEIKKDKFLRFYETFSPEQRAAPVVLKVSSGGYIITGCVSKYNNDAIIFRVDNNLELKYNNILVGKLYEIGRIIIPLTDNHYLFGFSTKSKDLPGINYSSDVATVFMNLEETIAEE